MGVSYFGCLIFGTHITLKQKPVSVTKYDVDTGVPYQTTRKVSGFFIGSSNTVMGFLDEEVEWEFRDQEIYMPTEDVGYFGVRLGYVDPQYGQAVDISMRKIAKAEEKYRELIGDNFSDEIKTELLRNKRLFLLGTGS